MTRPTCETCAYWHKGYRLQGFKVPSFCVRHHHSVAGDDPACREHQEKTS